MGSSMLYTLHTEVMEYHMKLYSDFFSYVYKY